MTPEEVLYYRNIKAPAYEEKNWTGPTKVAEGYIPRLASGPDGLFMLSQRIIYPENPKKMRRRYSSCANTKENTGTFEAPVQIARDSSSGLFEQGDLFENPETGALYVVWPEISGEEYVMKLWESTDGGQTFHGERNIARSASAMKVLLA